MKTKQRFVTAAVFAALMLLAGSTVAGDLNPPMEFPGPTMKTLDEIPPSWHQILPENKRFQFVMPAGDPAAAKAVLDKETGLVWARNAKLKTQKYTWVYAVNWIRNQQIGDRYGWRIPTVEELSSLLDPSLPGSPKVSTEFFDNVPTEGCYWTTTRYEDLEGAQNIVWIVCIGEATVGSTGKDSKAFLWPVRGGN